jgi:hypothetical protein
MQFWAAFDQRHIARSQSFDFARGQYPLGNAERAPFANHRHPLERKLGMKENSPVLRAPGVWIEIF